MLGKPRSIPEGAVKNSLYQGEIHYILPRKTRIPAGRDELPVVSNQALVSVSVGKLPEILIFPRRKREPNPHFPTQIFWRKY